MPSTLPRASEIDEYENEYLARLVGLHGNKLAMKRSKTLFDMCRYKYSAGASVEQVRPCAALHEHAAERR